MEEQQAMEMENERLVEQLDSLTSQVRLVYIKFYINLLVGGAGAEQGCQGG